VNVASDVVMHLRRLLDNADLGRCRGTAFAPGGWRLENRAIPSDHPSSECSGR
jgi:hypothetical protein